MPMESRYKGKKIDSMIEGICWWLKVAGDDTDDGEEFNNEVGNDETEESGSEESIFWKGNKNTLKHINFFIKAFKKVINGDSSWGRNYDKRKIIWFICMAC